MRGRRVVPTFCCSGSAVRRFARGFSAAAAILLLAACVGAAPPPADPSTDSWIAFEGVNLIPMTPGADIVTDQTVLVRNDRIAAVGGAAEVRLPAGTRLLDARGEYLLPGLADMHVHLEYFEDPAILKLFLTRGVTTVRNMDGRPYILEWKAAIESGEILGPAIYTAGPILDGDPPMRSDNTVVRDGAQARAVVREQSGAGYDFVKVYTNLGAEAYWALLQAAEEAQIPVAGPVPGELSIEAVLNGGQRAIEHLVDYGDLVESADSPFRDGWHWSKLYLGMPIDSIRMERAAALIAESDVWTIPTLVQADRALAPLDSVDAWLDLPDMAYLPGEAGGIWEEQARGGAARLNAEDWAVVARGRENRLRLLGALHRAGAHLLVGTDTPNPFVIPGPAVHQELANFVAAGMTPREAISAATVAAARFMGDLEEWGTVEAGKRADLLLVRGNPLDDVGQLDRPTGVMARGRWYPSEAFDGMLQDLRQQGSEPGPQGQPQRR